MRKTIMTVTLAVLAMGLMAGCGGGSSGAVATTTTLDLTGTVQTSATGVSGNISKGLFKATADDMAVACDSVTAYELGGTEAATGECNADGTFTLTPEKEEGEANYFVKATYGDDEVWSYISDTVTADTTALDVGTVDPDASLIVTDMLEQMGITNFFDIATALAGLTAIPSTFDPYCYFKMQKEVIEGADPTGAGLNDDTAKNRDACKLFCFGEGVDVTGYDKPYLCMKACMHGDFSSDLQATAGEYIDAAGIDYLTSEDWVTNYATYSGATDAFNSMIGTYMAGTAGSTAATMSLNPNLAGKAIGKVEAADTTVSTPCGEGGLVETDSDYVDKWKEMMLEADDLEQFQTTFGMGGDGSGAEDAFKMMMGQFDQFSDGGDWSNFDGDSMYSMFEGYEGDYGSFFNDDGTYKTEAFGTTYSYYMGTDFESFGTAEEKEQYFATMGTTFETGDWGDYYGKEDVYATQWQSEFESDPEGGSFTAPSDEDFTCMSTCMGTNSDLFSACQSECGMEIEQGEGGGGGPPPM